MCEFIHCLMGKVATLFCSKDFWELFLATSLGSLVSGYALYLCNKRLNKKLADLNYKYNKSIFLANEYWKASTEMNRGLVAIRMATDLLKNENLKVPRNEREQEVDYLYHEFLNAASNPMIKNNESINRATQEIRDTFFKERHGTSGREDSTVLKSQSDNLINLMKDEFKRHFNFYSAD